MPPYRNVTIPLAFFVVLLWSVPAAGFPHNAAGEQQTSSRAEELLRRRKEKLAAPPIGERNRAEDFFKYLESGGIRALYGINWHDLYPKFGGPRPGSGFGGGARYYKDDIKGSPITAEGSALFTTRGYRSFDFQLGAFNKTDPAFFTGPEDLGAPFDFMKDRRPGRTRRRDRAVLFLDVDHHHSPQERFWGLGGGSRAEDRTNFLLQSSSFALVGGYRFTRWFAVAAGAGTFDVDVEEGTDDRFPATQELFDDAAAPGLEAQPDFLRYATSVFFNYQDTPGNPHKGGIVGLFFFRYDDRDTDAYDFNRFRVDARHYIPLGSRQRTLALRVNAVIDKPDAGSRVPFYLMETLGGSRRLRGSHDFRYRDANLFHLTGEYRWEPAPALEFAFFYDTGKVYPTGESFAFEHLKKAFGIGVRFKGATGTFLRFDISRGDEGTRFQFAFGPSF